MILGQPRLPIRLLLRVWLLPWLWLPAVLLGCYPLLLWPCALLVGERVVLLLLGRLLKIVLLLGRLLGYRCNRCLRVVLLLSSSQCSLLGYRCNRWLRCYRGRCLRSRRCYNCGYGLSSLNGGSR